MDFELVPFSEIDVDDAFFDSLKNDYPGFAEWFEKKAENGCAAYVKRPNGRILAFLYIKDEPECEPIGDLPAVPRIKIGTLKIDGSAGNMRHGEGAIGIALWRWATSGMDQIYLTVYPKHESLIGMMEGFGFRQYGMKGGEIVLVKDRRNLDLSETKHYFPLIRKSGRAKIIPIEAEYHDRMFPICGVSDVDTFEEGMPVGNGITKMYIANPGNKIDYRINDIAFIYRKSKERPGINSRLTAYCVIESVVVVKVGGNPRITEDKFFDLIGNKTVFTDEELRALYARNNVYIIGMLYSGTLRMDGNLNYNWLHSNGLFDTHPYNIQLSIEDAEKILEEGGVDVQSAFID